MAICSRCSSAIRRLHPQEWRSGREDSEVNIKIPIFGRAGVNSCWICLKFSRWLEAEVPKVSKEWRRRSLQVKFTVFGRFQLKEPQQDIPMPLSMSISPLGQEENGLACGIELHFMSTTATVIVSKYLVLYVRR